MGTLLHTNFTLPQASERAHQVDVTMLKTTILLFAFFAIACVSGYGYGGNDNDLCGDPLATVNEANGVIDYLRKQPDNQRVKDILEQHPFIKDAENGKLDRERMVRWVVNTAYHLEREVRNVAGALDRHGTPYPTPERRQFLERALEMHRELLRRLEPLGKAFGIGSTEELLRREPSPDALIWSSHCAEIVQHADDITEIVAPFMVQLDTRMNIAKRMREALKRPEYKSWNINEDALKFFDSFEVVDRDEMEKYVNIIMRRGIERDITQCQLRRRLFQVNNGIVRFWDAANEKAPRGPSEGFKR